MFNTPLQPKQVHKRQLQGASRECQSTVPWSLSTCQHRVAVKRIRVQKANVRLKAWIDALKEPRRIQRLPITSCTRQHIARSDLVNARNKNNAEDVIEDNALDGQVDAGEQTDGRLQYLGVAPVHKVAHPHPLRRVLHTST